VGALRRIGGLMTGFTESTTLSFDIPETSN